MLNWFYLCACTAEHAWLAGALGLAEQLWAPEGLSDAVFTGYETKLVVFLRFSRRPDWDAERDGSSERPVLFSVPVRLPD